MQHVVIIGNGISGITAARHIRKASDDKITVISAESDHFFSRTALMYVYMGHMEYRHIKPYEDWFWNKNRIELIRDYVSDVLPDKKSVLLQKNGMLSYDKLIIATGSQPNMFDWPGQHLPQVQGLYSLQDLEKMEQNTRDISRAVVVGGGLIGIEMAEMLHSRGIHVTFLVREKSFWNLVLPAEESSMINDEIREHGIELMLSEELAEIQPDDNGNVKQVITASGKTIECQFVGITTGVRPNIDFLQGSGIETNRGVKVNAYFETNKADVYAIGDCAEFEEAPGIFRKNIEQVWYTGRMHGETLAQTITGNRTRYVPGHWFNSAKFFDVEYQTYGQVYAQLNENTSALFWKHPNQKKSIRIVYDSTKDTVMGFNLMGIRFRHEVCDQWLEEDKTIHQVVRQLSDAFFDPEFFTTYHHEVVKIYNEMFPDQHIEIKKKRFFSWL